MKERRKAERYPVECTALVLTPKEVRAAHIKDISETGLAFIFNGKCGMSEHEQVTVNIFSRDTDALISNVKCEIVRCFEENGNSAIGVQLLDRYKGINDLVEYLYNKNLDDIFSCLKDVDIAI